MHSENQNGQKEPRLTLEGVMRDSSAMTEENTPSSGLVFMQLEEDGSMTPSSKPVGRGEYSFVEHLSSREIYQMPDANHSAAGRWQTYVPRFTGAGEHYRVASSAPKKPREVPVEDLRRTKEPPEEQVETIEQAPPAVQIVATTPTDNPPVPSDPTAEEDFAPLTRDATVVTVTPGNTVEPGEDVFVLQKPTAARQNDGDAERTEEDERREILDAISPLQEQPDTPEEQPVLTAEQSSTVQFEQIPTVVPTPAPEHEIYYAIPDPVIETREQATQHPHTPDYDLPKESSRTRGEERARAEFTSFTQRLAFKDRFLDTILSVKVRLVAASALTLLLFVLAMLPVFGVNLIQALSLHALPSAIALVDMQGVICLFALALPEIFRALREIHKGRVYSEIFLVVGLILMAVYTVFIVILAPISYPLFGSLYGLLAVTAILSSCFFQSAAFLSFKLVSLPEKKNTVIGTMTRTLVHENLALDGAIDEYKSKLARVFCTSFVGEFFKKNKTTKENSIKILTSVCISLASAIVVGSISFLLHGMQEALSSFMSVVFFSMPIFYVLSHKISYYMAQRLCREEDATVIGEGSFDEYAAIDVVAYEDSEIFGAEDVALRRFKLIGDEKDFTKPLYQMASLFGAVGGPLSVLFANALERRPSTATDVTVEEDGVLGVVDGMPVLAGTEAFMYRHGVEIAADESAPGLDSAPTTKVLYAAEGAQAHAKFYIRYSFSEEFTMLLPALREVSVTPLIYTRDPNISNELLSALTLGGGNIRVMKKYNLPSAEAPVYDRLDGGIVTLGDKTRAINVILLCKRYRTFIQKVEQLVSLLCICGASFGAVSALFLSSLSLPIWVFVLWHCAWIGAVAIMAHSTFRIPKTTQKDS